MKKLFLVSLLFVMFMFLMPAFAENIMEPQWSEFCPPLYQNAVYKDAKENSKRYMENNYWALRRVKFQKSIAECKKIAQNQSELNACFARVANLESNKTAQRKEAKAEKNSDLDREMRDSGTGMGYGYHYYWY